MGYCAIGSESPTCVRRDDSEVYVRDQEIKSTLASETRLMQLKISRSVTTQTDEEDAPACFRNSGGKCSRDAPKKHRIESETFLTQHHTFKSIPTRTVRGAVHACCKNCGGKSFCSPNSGNCYDDKLKDHCIIC